MGTLLKVIGIAYLVATAASVYAIIQTSVNYANVLETCVKFDVAVVKLNVTTDSKSAKLEYYVHLENPSKLTVSVNLIEYTIYIYNKSKDVKQGEPIYSYSSYDIVTLLPGKSLVLKFEKNIPAKLELINRLRSLDPKARIMYNMHITYRIDEFPDWNSDSQQVRRFTYWETSSYG
jgi:hypothetical protein